MQEGILCSTVWIMIEVKARLLRGSVFFAGECIECEIIFTNTASERKESCNQTCNHAVDSQCTKDNCETDRLAWASAQIHCQCTVNESRVKLPSRTDRMSDQISTDSNASCTSFVPSRGERTNSLLVWFTTGFCWYAIGSMTDVNNWFELSCCLFIARRWRRPMFNFYTAKNIVLRFGACSRRI